MTWAMRAALLSMISMAACNAIDGRESPIRDLRPTKAGLGDKLLVELRAPALEVGAPTVLVLDGPRLRLPARAVAADRAVVELDAGLERALDGKHLTASTTITLEQGARRFTSDARDPFAIDLFPRDLRKAALAANARAHLPTWIALALALLLAAALVAAPIPLIAGLIVVWERKVSGYMQSRWGPNRVGPNGWLQWLADGIKLLLKEDLVPTDADPLLFKAAPYLAFVGLFLTFIVLPFSHTVIVADLDVGLLFLLSVTSLVVVSIILGGWSSNSKWSLLGGMRSAAQIISYELPGSLALLTLATLTGSLSTQKLVAAQGGAPWNWFLLRNPFTFVAFFIWFLSALAEGNRTPFDLPEAESELVAGYNTEYSGFRFSLFPMVEWVNLFVIGAVASMLFLGGWRLPHVTPRQMEAHAWLEALGFLVFVAKDVAVIFVIIWIRWTLPRFRVDQMMNLCWKYLLPFALAGFVGVLAWAWLVPHAVDVATRGLLFLVAVAGTVWFVSRVRYNQRRYLDLELNDVLARHRA